MTHRNPPPPLCGRRDRRDHLWAHEAPTGRV